MGAVLALFAIDAPAAAAAPCYPSQQQLPAQATADFRANPPQLLAQIPNGGTALASQVRDLVASDPATLAPVIALIAKANKDQQEAIGTGLAQAALVCIAVDQAFATEIQYAAAASGNDALMTAYATAIGDRPTCGASCGAPPAPGQGAGEKRAENTVQPAAHKHVRRARLVARAHRRFHVQYRARLFAAHRSDYRAWRRRVGCAGPGPFN